MKSPSTFKIKVFLDKRCFLKRTLFLIGEEILFDIEYLKYEN